ncbi:hypothetical protein TNCV_2338031 [Trichonephila clavipes]|nr:hypothetical protein TNCV_2338031 [Trichonephila clavipes]
MAKGYIVSLSLGVALSTMSVTEIFWLVSIPILRENTLGLVRSSHLSCPSTNLMRGFAARRPFRVPPHHEDNIHLQTSMPCMEFEPRSYGTAVSVANDYTG